MEVKDYLIVYGRSVDRGYPCYKETEINCNDIIKYMPLIKKIEENISKERNWTGGINIEPTPEGYVEHNKLYEMYPEFSHEILDGLSKLLPNGITKIESIKIFNGTKIKII